MFEKPYQNRKTRTSIPIYFLQEDITTLRILERKHTVYECVSFVLALKSDKRYFQRLFPQRSNLKNNDNAWQVRCLHSYMVVCSTSWNIGRQRNYRGGRILLVELPASRRQQSSRAVVSSQVPWWQFRYSRGSVLFLLRQAVLGTSY